MPASMMSAGTGGRLKVIGSSTAIVATGPTPGSTPISVPSSTPMNAYRRLSHETATPNPIPRLPKTSIALPSADRAGVHKIGADRERQRKRLHEHQDREHDQHHVQDRHLLPLELMAAECADEHQHRGGEDQPERLHQVAVGDAGGNDQHQRPRAGPEQHGEDRQQRRRREHSIVGIPRVAEAELGGDVEDHNPDDEVRRIEGKPKGCACALQPVTVRENREYECGGENSGFGAAGERAACPCRERKRSDADCQVLRTERDASCRAVGKPGKERAQENHRAEARQHSAENRGEVGGTHAHRRSHLVLRDRPQHEEQADHDKHQARPEVLRIPDFHRSPPRRCAAVLCAKSVTCGPSQPARAAGCGKPPQLAPLAPDAVVLAFGDSLTYGTGANEEESYPAQLANIIGRRAGAGGGTGGGTSPRLLLLMIGGNDFLRRLGKEQAEANVRAMVKLAKDRGVDVVLIGTPEPGFTVSPPGFYANIASEFRIPYEEDVIGAVLKDSSLKSDQIHPNASGYRLVAERVGELLRKSGAI